MTPDDTAGEIERWKVRAEEAERLANEYKAQLHTETLKGSASNSRNHLSQLDLEDKRTRLQKRIDDLENLPELLKQEEMKNEKLQKRIRELEDDNTRLRKDVHGQVINLQRSHENERLIQYCLSACLFNLDSCSREISRRYLSSQSRWFIVFRLITSA